MYLTLNILFSVILWMLKYLSRFIYKMSLKKPKEKEEGKLA